MRQQTFQRDFRSRKELFEEHAIQLGIAPRGDLRRAQQARDAIERRAQRGRVVGTDHAATRRQHERLHHAGKWHVRGHRRAQFERVEPRHWNPGAAQPFARKPLVARRLDRLRSVVRQTEDPLSGW